MFTSKNNKIAAVLFLALVFSLTGCVPGLNEKLDETKDKEIAKAISESPKWQKLERDCQEIPLAPGTRLIRRGMSTHGPNEIYYYFRSDNGVQETKNLLDNYFKNGWESGENLSTFPETQAFRRGDLWVNTQYGGMGNSITYSITCRRLETADP